MNSIAEVIELIETENLAQDEEVMFCNLFDNGFRFCTKKGWRLFDFNGKNILAPYLEEGEKVLYCELYDNCFEFETEEKGFQLFDLNGNNLLTPYLDEGDKVTSCLLLLDGSFELKIKRTKKARPRKRRITINF